jgi:3-oxoadipate enol-lactonase
VKSLNVNGGELRYIDQGTGRPLLLVHGFPLDHSMWAGQIDGLSSQHRVIAPDLRGLGRSPARGTVPIFAGTVAQPWSAKMGLSPLPGRGDVMTMEAFADDLAALLDGLGVREPVACCGLSMGGYIAFQFWRKYGDRLRALILCDTRSTPDTPEVAEARLAMADRVLREGPTPLVESMMPRLFCDATRQDHPEIVEALQSVMLRNDPRGIAAAARGMAVRPDMTPALPQIHCPTLVIVGQHDVISPPAEMRMIADAIPTAQYVEIAGAGHMAPMEKPQEVAAAMDRFLASV